LLDAPRILSIGFCLPTDDGRCRVIVLHSAVDGAASYQMVTAANVTRDCGDSSFVCDVRFPSAPGCGVTLRALDKNDNPGRSSRSFCVEEQGPD
jgi:hypothetical protein